MIPLIPHSIESSMIMGAWGFKPVEATATGVTGYLVIEAHIELPATRKNCSHQTGTSVAELAARYENDPRKSAALIAARKILAKRLQGINSVSLAQLRLKKGYSQAQLGKLMGVAQPQVARIERGDDAKLSTLEKLAEALEVTFVELSAAVHETRKVRARSLEA